MYLLYDLCGTSSGLQLIKFIKELVHIICIAAPISVIMIIMLSFIRNVISPSSPEDLAKVGKLAIKRVVICAFVFFVPTLVNVTMSLLGDNGLEYAKCIQNATTENIERLKQQEQTGEKTPTNSTPEKQEEPKQPTPEKTEKLEFKLSKELVVLAHYHGNKISKYTIKITDKKGKKLKASKFDFKIKKPIATISKKGTIVAKFAGSTTITVSPKDDSFNKQTIKLTVIKGTYTKVRTKNKMKALNLKTGKQETLHAGTDGIYNGSAIEFNSVSGKKIYYHGDTLKVGNNYYEVPYENVQSYDYSISKDYSKEEVEEFINSNKFQSATKYLFWMNLGTQSMYVFKWSHKKWNYFRTNPINTGDVLGLNAAYNDGNCNGTKRTPPWAFGLGSCSSSNNPDIDANRLDTHWHGYWAGLYLVIFNHKDNGGGFGAWHEGFSEPKKPVSHGCVRHRVEDLVWVRDHLSKLGGSRIVKF